MATYTQPTAWSNGTGFQPVDVTNYWWGKSCQNVPGGVPPFYDPSNPTYAAWYECMGVFGDTDPHNDTPGWVADSSVIQPFESLIPTSDYPIYLVNQGYVIRNSPWAVCGEIVGGVVTFHSPCRCRPPSYFPATRGRCSVIHPLCGSGRTFDVANGMCRAGTPDPNCPPGTRWDPVCSRCVSNTPPQPCMVWQGCAWVHPANDCASPGIWNPTTCQCNNCPPSGDLPPCAEERDCYWDYASCQYRCEDPSCPAGQEWNWQLCQCIPQCPPGKCYCAAQSPPGCVDCQAPPCSKALNCVWSPVACNYTCDNPDTRCGGGTFNWTTCACNGEGVDLAQVQLGFLFRAHQDNGTLKVGRSTDTGVTWETVDVVSGLPADAAPTLTVLPDDDLLVWYHSSDGHAICYRSENYGATWTAHADLSGVVKRYPRAVMTEMGFRLVSHDGETLRVYASENLGVDVGEIHQFTTELQLVSLHLDFRGWLHMVYGEGGNVLHRFSDDGGDTWSEAYTLTAGALPSVSYVGERGMLAFWSGGELTIRLVDESYRSITPETPAAPEGFNPGWLGLLWDRSRPSLIYTAGKDADLALRVRFTDDMGIEWAEPS